MLITAVEIKELAHACGFELAGVASAVPPADFMRFQHWREKGFAGEMAYLTDRRGDLRADPRNLLPTAQSILCVGKLYNTAHPHTADMTGKDRGWISRYAWGQDYHNVLRQGLESLVSRIAERHKDPFTWKICVDTAPLLERSFAQMAGLGWIGKNTCLINQQQGSWFFLGELLLSIPLLPDAPPPHRCGTCTRCIDACPTAAIVPDEAGGWTLDSRACISYLTIEKRGEISRELAEKMSDHVFGCDICQDVCPWNRRAPITEDSRFQPRWFAPPLESLAELSEDDFRRVFQRSPVRRAKYAGFIRNTAIAIGNSGNTQVKKIYFRLVALAALAALPAFPSANSTIRLEDPLKNPGFVHFYNLEYDQALTDFERQAQCNPDDPFAYNAIAQTVLFREMFRDGALESELVTGTNPFLRRPKMQISAENKERFNSAINRAIELSRAQAQKNPEDIGALYSLVVGHGLRANYLFLVEKAWLDSLHEATEARKANDKILALDPDFVDAHLASGMSEYIVGCLPMYMRILGKIRGFHGDKENGIKQLEWVAHSGTLDRYDASVLLAAIYRREHRPKQAVQLLNGLVATFPRNYLFRFEQVQMYSDLGDKQSALQVLARIRDLHDSGAPGYAGLPLQRIQYAKGNLLFWYGDLDPALADLKQATRQSDDLDLNTAVMAWLRLGQVYDLKGEHAQAVKAYRETLKTAPQSAPASEAEGYISTPYHRKPATG